MDQDRNKSVYCALLLIMIPWMNGLIPSFELFREAFGTLGGFSSRHKMRGLLKRAKLDLSKKLV